MRFTIPALNNDYFDEDYLRVFGFPKMGKNVRIHRSVVFMNPSNVSIGHNVTILPYCVFGSGISSIGDGATVGPFHYEPGRDSEPAKADADRIKELEALLAEREQKQIDRIEGNG
jgi:acetyltransferase-like isoleucine patch superfamily enzyme